MNKLHQIDLYVSIFMWHVYHKTGILYGNSGYFTLKLTSCTKKNVATHLQKHQEIANSCRPNGPHLSGCVEALAPDRIKAFRQAVQLACALCVPFCRIWLSSFFCQSVHPFFVGALGRCSWNKNRNTRVVSVKTPKVSFFEFSVLPNISRNLCA